METAKAHSGRTLDCTLLPRLASDELFDLISWTARLVERQGDDVNEFTTWLCKVLRCELLRRETPGAEMGLVRLPATSLKFLVAAIPTAYAWPRASLTENQAAFVDGVSREILIAAGAILEQLGENFILDWDSENE